MDTQQSNPETQPLVLGQPSHGNQRLEIVPFTDRVRFRVVDLDTGRGMATFLNADDQAALAHHLAPTLAEDNARLRGLLAEALDLLEPTSSGYHNPSVSALARWGQRANVALSRSRTPPSP